MKLQEHLENPPKQEKYCPSNLVWGILTTPCFIIPLIFWEIGDNKFPTTSILTLWCSLPFGIVSVLYAFNVIIKKREGDIETALKYSKRAAGWAVTAFLAPCLGWCIGLFHFIDNWQN